MPKPSHRYSLHSRIAAMLIIIAALSSIFYAIFINVIIDKLEDAMLATLVGHEIDEIVIDLAENPDTKLPKTASLNAYLLSRDKQSPIPGYLKDLEPGSKITVGEKTFHVAILDLQDDRMYLSFDITHLSKYGNVLLILLIGGGILTAILLLFSGIWFSRKFLLPVSTLAEEVANIKPNDRNVRIEEKYRDYEVGLIAKSIDQFMDRMDDFVEREQSFTAAVSHELRTPVAVISTATELLEMNGSIVEKQRGALQRIKTSTKYMQGVIESLLFFARQANGSDEKTIPEILINAVITDILKDYVMTAKEKNLLLRFKSSSNLLVRIPENHLAIIVGNLVQNAINNTAEGEVCVTVLRHGFSVSDTGKGIETNDIDHIVERCYHSPDSAGCGLGLYLVSNICSHYNLKLEIESSVGSGSKFSVKFPGYMLHTSDTSN